MFEWENKVLIVTAVFQIANVRIGSIDYIINKATVDDSDFSPALITKLGLCPAQLNRNVIYICQLNMAALSAT